MTYDILVPPWIGNYTDDRKYNAHRRYHFILGIIYHNEPITTQGIQTIVGYNSREFPNGIKPILRLAMQNDHIKRRKHGWKTTDTVIP